MAEELETKVENTAKICFKPKITLKDLNIETTNEVKKETTYEKMSLTKLKEIAKEKGIKGYSKMDKEEIIKELEK